MSVLLFLKKHKDDVTRVLAVTVLVAVMATFIAVFRGDKLPYASDGDAFDTIYALEDAAPQDDTSY